MPTTSVFYKVIMLAQDGLVFYFNSCYLSWGFPRSRLHDEDSSESDFINIQTNFTNVTS